MKTSHMISTRMRLTLRALAFSAFATALVVMSLPEMAFTKKPRKLPISSYITGAKIAYGKTTGDEDPRPYDALSLLDSCTIWYGMIPEVYFWETLIHSDLTREIARTDTVARKESLLKMIGATDSLALACEKENKKVKKKYKKKCAPFLITADSIRADWFAQYYNDAQENREQLVDLMLSIAEETDLETKADLEAQQDELLQSSISDYGVASSLAPTDSLAQLVILNLANLYSDDLQDYEKAIPYLAKAAESVKLSDPLNYQNLINQMAFSNFQLKNYLEAARIWHESADAAEGDEKIRLYGNILACFGSLNLDDSIFYYNQKILKFDPANSAALAMIGGKWFNRIQGLNQQSSKHEAAGDKAKVAEVKKELALASDSAIVYLKRAFEADSTDSRSIELYAIASMLKGDKISATVAWLKLTALKPNDKSYWVYLGDNYIGRQKLKDAIGPYEKAVAIDDSDVDVWRSLIDLYAANNMTEKLKKAQAKYDALSNR